MAAARAFRDRGVARKPAQASIGVGDRRGNRLIHFVRQGGGQLSHGGHPVDVREVRLRLAQSLALFLRPLAFGDVHHGTHEFNEFAGWAENRMAHYVDISDLAAGMNDSVIQLELRRSRVALSSAFATLG